MISKLSRKSYESLTNAFFPLLKLTTISLTIVRKRNRWNDSRSLIVCAPF